jgi:hypothetical protein
LYSCPRTYNLNLRRKHPSNPAGKISDLKLKYLFRLKESKEICQHTNGKCDSRLSLEKGEKWSK